jgi:hypothetical protein
VYIIAMLSHGNSKSSVTHNHYHSDSGSRSTYGTYGDEILHE